MVLGRFCRRLLSSPSTAAAAPPKLLSVSVNGTKVQVPETMTVMQACASVGVDIPRFCFHERLAIAGNCRMCLVQVNDGAKLVASCAAPVMPDMRIATESAAVKKAREGVMEFLLANHPLDCPICDQGGECDLQDQAMAFGADRSRFPILKQNKRAVEDKDFGPLVKTSMNRCIHCTRCVRFANEVAGMEELGTTGRGNDMQIGTYIERTLLGSPLSGNLVDLCPVGALTSKPYAFTARPWELRHTDSIDVMDAMGAAIKVDSRGMEVMRILPRVHEDINEEWLGDKSRFAYDALRRQRLVQPLLRQGNELIPLSWEEGLQMAADRLMATPAAHIHGVVGRFGDVESIYSLSLLLRSIGAPRLLLDGCHQQSDLSLPAEITSELRFTTGIAAVEDSDAVLIVGCNPLKDAPLLNARLCKTWLRQKVAIGLVGKPANLTYDYTHLGDDYRGIQLEGAFGGSFSKAKRPMIIVGQDALFSHPDADQTWARVMQLSRAHQQSLLTEDWRGLNLLPTMASATGALMLGCDPKPIPPSAAFLYLLAADDLPAWLHDLGMPRSNMPRPFIVYQGHHGDVGAGLADLIFPTAAYTEKDATYVNMEGRTQHTRAAVPPPGEAREDWSIVRALSEFCRRSLPFDSLAQVRGHLWAHTGVALTDRMAPSHLGRRLAAALTTSKSIWGVSEGNSRNATPYGEMADFYLTDCISRNSPTMAKCSLAFTHKTVRDSHILDSLKL